MSLSGGTKSGLSQENPLSDLTRAYHERLEESQQLISSHPSTAMALRLYALEILIKTRVCRILGLDYLPNHCKTHDLAELILFTGHFKDLEDISRPNLRQNWERLVKFSKESLNNLRYSPNDKMDALKIAILTESLDDPTDGVWTWLSNYP